MLLDPPGERGPAHTLASVLWPSDLARRGNTHSQASLSLSSCCLPGVPGVILGREGRSLPPPWLRAPHPSAEAEAVCSNGAGPAGQLI